MKLKIVIIFFILFVISFCYSFFVSGVYSDEIWNYGVAYNISLGMIPYRDFNLVTTPLYPMLASIFIKLLGHHLYSFHIFDSLVLSFLGTISICRLGRKGLLLFPVILFNGYPGYNIFSVLIIILLLNLLEKNFLYQDFIIGFLVGLAFLTKQTVGICLFIPMIYYSKCKFKSFFSFLIPILIFVVFLIYYSALYSFIDYCFLGLFDFGNSNSIFLFLPVEIIICLILIYLWIKSKFKNQQLLYILCFQIITVPIFDDYHFIIGLIPVLYYYLSCKNIKSHNFKYYFIIILSFSCYWNFFVHYHDFGHLYSDKDSYLYGRSIPLYIESEVNRISNYIIQERENYDYIYFFSANAYYVKMNVEYPLSKFDMICNGNMGYNGANKYIKEVNDYCIDHSCMFILYRYEFRENNISQTNRKLVNYVKNKYLKVDDLGGFDIYNNLNS